MSGLAEKGLSGLFALVLFIFLFFSTVQASSNDFSLSINPENPLIFAGETDSLEITVTNGGDNIDSYTLGVIDDAGWDLKLQEDRWENVGPGEQRTTILSVTVPKDTKIGFEENITVTVLSSAGIKENATCKVGVLRGDVTDWGYVTTGVGVVITAIVIVLVLWKGGI